MKISVIMQSYLGDYPGSRSNPEMKFIRAVYSIIGQTYSNWELIIASDGCEITEKLYKEHFQHYDNIKFFMVEKPKGTEMYSDNRSYFRGKPRAVAVKNATGDWISYLDADDIYVKDGLDQIVSKIKTAVDVKKDVKCILNNCIIENTLELEVWDKVHSKTYKTFVAKQVQEITSIPGLSKKWVAMSIFNTESDKHAVPTGTYALIHKRGYPSWEWGDSTDPMLSEDNAFINPMVKEWFEGLINTPIYVRCHSKLWDL